MYLCNNWNQVGDECLAFCRMRPQGRHTHACAYERTVRLALCSSNGLLIVSKCRLICDSFFFSLVIPPIRNGPSAAGMWTRLRSSSMAGHGTCMGANQTGSPNPNCWPLLRNSTRYGSQYSGVLLCSCASTVVHVSRLLPEVSSQSINHLINQSIEAARVRAGTSYISHAG
jgi:hypothetical protein